MATTTKKRQSTQKKAADTKKKPATPAISKKPAVKKQTSKVKPKLPATKGNTKKTTDMVTSVEDGSDRIHVKDGKVVDVVKQASPKATKTVKPAPSVDETSIKEVSEREEIFCQEYVCGGRNATKAYAKAYPGTTYHAQRNNGARKLRQAHVKQRIAQLHADRLARLSVTGDRIFEEAAKLAFFDPRSFFDADNRLIPVQNLNPDDAAVIAGIETLHKIVGEDTDGMAVTTKIKLSDKRGALEFLARILKMTSEATPSQDQRIGEVLKKVQAGDMTALDGAYELQIAGLPLPEVLKLQLSRPQVDVDVNAEFTPMSEEEIERRANARLEEVKKQRDEFLPQRRAEVAEIKDRLKDQDSFAPERFEGE